MNGPLLGNGLPVPYPPSGRLLARPRPCNRALPGPTTRSRVRFPLAGGSSRAHAGGMTTATITFRIHPVPESVISAARERGVDANGRRVEHLTAEGGEPLRCCLSNALPGEALVLFGFSPE